jgi:hypothetical protein
MTVNSSIEKLEQFYPSSWKQPIFIFSWLLTMISYLVITKNGFSIEGFVFVTLISIPIYFVFIILSYYRKQPKLIFNSDLNNCLDDIIHRPYQIQEDEENAYLVLISAYLNFGKRMLSEIESLVKERIPVILVFNSENLKNEVSKVQIKKLGELGVDLYHHPNLHTKLYFNSKIALQTSMNLNKYSMINSIESGFVITHQSQIENCWEHLLEIIGNEETTRIEADSISVETGYCIRTKRKILLDESRPIEFIEYRNSRWRKLGRFCHKCGEEAKGVKVGAPFCKNCI